MVKTIFCRSLSGGLWLIFNIIMLLHNQRCLMHLHRHGRSEKVGLIFVMRVHPGKVVTAVERVEPLNVIIISFLLLVVDDQQIICFIQSRIESGSGFLQILDSWLCHRLEHVSHIVLCDSIFLKKFLMSLFLSIRLHRLPNRYLILLRDV